MNLRQLFIHLIFNITTKVLRENTVEVLKLSIPITVICRNIKVPIIITYNGQVLAGTIPHEREREREIQCNLKFTRVSTFRYIIQFTW